MQVRLLLCTPYFVQIAAFCQGERRLRPTRTHYCRPALHRRPMPAVPTPRRTASPLWLSWLLGGQCHEIFCFMFFHESSSPKPLIITLRSFQIFLKFAEIFTSQGAPPVSTTLVANFQLVSTTPEVNLPLVPGGDVEQVMGTISDCFTSKQQIVNGKPNRVSRKDSRIPKPASSFPNRVNT